MMQISRPSDSRGIPPKRWVYKIKSHALAVLQEYIDRGSITVSMFEPNAEPERDDRRRPWLLIVELPARTQLAESLKRHTFGSLLGAGSTFEESFPAYYTYAWSRVREVIEVDKNDDEWLAMQVQRKLLKTAGSAG
jgi:hypothetical protein